MLHKFMQFLLCATAVSTLSVASALPTGGGGGGDSHVSPALPMWHHDASKAFFGALKNPENPTKNWLPPKGKDEEWVFTYTEEAARRGYRDLRKKHHGGKDWKGLVVTLYVPELGVYAATKGSGSFIDEHKKDAPVWAKAAGGGGGKHGDVADTVLWLVEKSNPGYVKEQNHKGKKKDFAYPVGTYMAAYGTLSGDKPDHTDPCLVPGSLRDTNRVCRDMLKDLGIDRSLDSC